MLWAVFFHNPMPTPNNAERGMGNLKFFLKLLNLFELQQELDQPVSPIADLSDLLRTTELTLQTLEEAFEKVSSSCSHWTINSLFGSGVIASSLEKLVHQAEGQFNPNPRQETSDPWKIKQFTHSLVAELTISISLNCLGLVASINPVLTSLGIVSAALGETLVQHMLSILSIQSFSVFTELIRQRIAEYSEFRDFIPEYRLYTHFFQTYQYQPAYNLQIVNSQDQFKIFKLIHTLAGVTNRRDLLYQLMRILEKDEIFQQRLKQKFSPLGVIFWKLSSVLSAMLREDSDLVQIKMTK